VHGRPLLLLADARVPSLDSGAYPGFFFVRSVL